VYLLNNPLLGPQRADHYCAYQLIRAQDFMSQSANNKPRCKSCNGRHFTRSRLVLLIHCDPALVLFGGGSIVLCSGLLGLPKILAVIGLILAVIPAFISLRLCERCDLCGAAPIDDTAGDAPTPWYG